MRRAHASYPPGAPFADLLYLPLLRSRGLRLYRVLAVLLQGRHCGYGCSTCITNESQLHFAMVSPVLWTLEFKMYSSHANLRCTQQT